MKYEYQILSASSPISENQSNELQDEIDSLKLQLKLAKEEVETLKERCTSDVLLSS